MRQSRLGAWVGLLRNRNTTLGALLQFLNQCWHKFVQVSAHSQISNLEDRFILILVDHHDGTGGLHARRVLGTTGAAQTTVDLRRDSHGGWTNLQGKSVPAATRCATGGTSGGCEGTGSALYYPTKIIADATVTGHDRIGGAEIRTCGLFSGRNAHTLH